MNRNLRRVLDKLIDVAEKLGVVRTESYYRVKARRHGVQFLGVFERNRMALFQDPITGSSFAVAENEAVESGIRRVRSRFGIPY